MSDKEKKIENLKNSNKKTKKKRTLFQKIINVFLYIAITFIILLLIGFGFTQTSTFRNYLRETLIEKADSAINGKLNIEEIDGTIFTSIILKNTLLTSGQDTLLNANTIILKTSPLQLFLKKIYIRNFEIRNANIYLLTDENSELNISKLFPPSQNEETDTTKSSFPFNIEVANLDLKNVNFSLQDYSKKGSDKFYPSLNMDDLRVKNINLSLNAFADINKNDFKLNIHKLYADPNIANLIVNDLSGKFTINKNLLDVNDFNLTTNRSKLFINASLKNFDVFSSSSSLKNAEVNLDVKSDSLDFDDLTAFVESTDILKGKVYSEIKTSGKFSDMEINSIKVNYDSTQLEASGSIRNLDNPEKVFITASFINSHVNQSDVNKLMPSLKIPVYKELGIIRFDTLKYQGTPLNFKTKFYAKTLKGDIFADGNLNLEMKEMGYDINFKTINFDISPFTGIVSKLNSSGSIKGKGTEPKNLNASINFRAGGSIIEGNKFDTLKVSSTAKAKKINYNLLAVSDTASASLKGFFDFTKETPSYKSKGLVNNLNIQKLSKDSTFNTKLNFEVDVSGQNFDLDKMSLYMTTTLFNSSIDDIKIDTTRAIVDLGYDPEGKRVVNIVSDLADITLTGNFSLSQTINLLSSEADLISSSVQKKVDEIFPTQTGGENKSSLKASDKKQIFANVDSAETLEYTIEFKNFELLSVFLGKNQLEVDGSLNGKIINSSDSISFTANSNLNYVKYWGKNDVFFLSNLILNMNLENSLNAASLKDIKTDFKFRTKRIFMGSDIEDASIDLKLFENTAEVNISANYENEASAKILGEIDLQSNSIKMNLDSLILGYNQFILKNKKNIDVVYSQNKIDINNFTLIRNSAEININGTLLRSGNQDLKIAIKNFKGKDVSVNIFELNPLNALLTKLNLTAEIKGDFFAPIITSELTLDSVTYKEKNFGKLVGNINYKNKNINTNIKFISSDTTLRKPPLKIYGNIPYNLSFNASGNNTSNNQNMDINFTADNFNLGAFGNTLPFVKQLSGQLTAELKVSGTLENLKPNGFLTLENVDFIAAANNLGYNLGLKVKIQPDLLSLDSLDIRNSKDTPKGGRMTGSGKAEMQNLDITSSEISVDGTLKVLGEQSKGASPAVYGDLVIATNGNVIFKINKDRAFLEAPIKVIEADLTFPPSQGGYSNNLNNFIYKFVTDTSKEKKQMDFESLVKLSEERNSSKTKTDNTKFDYKIDVQVENEAKIVFILSKELNQKLTAVLEGNFQYERIGGRPDAQGELKLLEGSTLEFIKTLTASGSIRFESELDNPYLNITATYSDYIYSEASQTSETGNGKNDESSSSVSEKPVEVRIKVQGPLKQLDKNLIQDKNNIAVYIGQNNIDNDQPNPQYDASDAITFIALGKFPEENTNNNTNQIASTTTSFAGSILGGFLNSYLGDYVRSVQFRRVGSTTKVSVSGRVNKFRYSVGGATDVFQDLSQANVKIEYPIFKSLLARLERKEALGESKSINNVMIYELGLKYRFEF